MPAPAERRLEQQREAAERKKALAAKLIGTGARQTKAPSPPFLVANANEPQVSVPKLAMDRATVPAEARAELKFTLRLAEDNLQVHLSNSYEGLATRMLAVSRTREKEFVLLWPGTLRSLGLAHALATMSVWSQGDKKGRRTLLYPAKANFLHGLNHLVVDRIEVGRLAAKFYEAPREVNPAVCVSLPEKDSFLTALNSVKEPNGQALHPTVSELLPHFYSDLSFQAWKACDGELLRNMKARLGDRDHAKSLSALALKSLGAPDRAPDALFALGWRTPLDDIPDALRSVKRLGSPDVVLIDVTRATRRSNPKWKASIVRFLEALEQVWTPQTAPGVCIVSDEPHVRRQILQELTKRSQKGNEDATRVLRGGFPSVGVPCTVSRDGILRAGESENLEPAPREIKVAFTDTQASEVIGLVDRLKNSVKQDEWRQPLADVASYLLRLASLPSSTRTLLDWLEQVGAPLAAREAYTWPSYRAKLARLRDDPQFTEKGRLERIVARADKLWVDYENGTPFARQLADIIEEHTRGTEKCCVVFTRPTARVLAERYFQTYDGYPEGAGFEVLADCVRFTTSNTLASELQAANRNETIIFAGLDEESLRLLLSDERLSSTVYVLLTQRNAAFLKATLRAVSGCPEFATLLSRVKPLLAQLPDFADAAERALLSAGDFVLPTFSFEQALSTVVEDPEDADPDAWELVLDSGRSVRRSPTAHVYVYDALLSHTQTRGYKRVDVADLVEGNRLFMMSGELRELTETALKEAGVPISNDKKFEAALRSYHRRVLQAIRGPELGSTLTDKARTLRERMLATPNCPKNLPEESTVRSWIDVERLLALDFDKAKPQAPRLEAHFRVFSVALQLSDVEAIYFWKAVILPLRGVRRADGRRVGDVYADMLLEPESVVVHRRLQPAVVSALFSRAKENIYTIEAIRKPQEEAAHD